MDNHDNSNEKGQNLIIVKVFPIKLKLHNCKPGKRLWAAARRTKKTAEKKVLSFEFYQNPSHFIVSSNLLSECNAFWNFRISPATRRRWQQRCLSTSSVSLILCPDSPPFNYNCVLCVLFHHSFHFVTYKSHFCIQVVQCSPMNTRTKCDMECSFQKIIMNSCHAHFRILYYIVPDTMFHTFYY